jgi:DNA-binding MarR family transcriptional regulator
MVATSKSAPIHRTRPAGTPSGPAVTEAELTAGEAARRVARLFPEVYRRYHWANRVQGADLPVTRRALEVLQHLSASGPLTVGEQAEHLGLRRNSVSELLQRLEAKGLVARIRDERDERRVLVWLTDSGRAVVSRVGQVLAPDLIAQVMANLSPEERATVIRGVELLATTELPTPPTTAPPVATSTERNHR